MLILWMLCVLCIGKLHLSLGLLHRCPQNISSYNCNCVKNENVSVTCSEIHNTIGYHEALQLFKNYAIDTFLTQLSSDLSLHSGYFKRLYMESVKFVSTAFDTLPLLTFLDGLEECLKEIHFVRCNVTKWVWMKGIHFGFLRIIHFESTSFNNNHLTKTITSVFPRKIRILRIIYCGIEALGEKALRRFGLLEQLQLQGNRLLTIEREVLPFPARRLRLIDLSDNRLVTLPNDSFVQMRRLEILNLSRTSLTVLDETTFQPVWEQLEDVSFYNLTLNCDCETSWLLNITLKTKYLEPSCETRGNVKQLLTSFTSKDLCE